MKALRQVGLVMSHGCSRSHTIVVVRLCRERLSLLLGAMDALCFGRRIHIGTHYGSGGLNVIVC